MSASTTACQKKNCSCPSFEELPTRNRKRVDTRDDKKQRCARPSCHHYQGLHTSLAETVIRRVVEMKKSVDELDTAAQPVIAKLTIEELRPRAPAFQDTIMMNPQEAEDTDAPPTEEDIRVVEEIKESSKDIITQFEQNYKRVSTLGNGACADVYLVKSKINGNNYVHKVVNMSGSSASKIRRAMGEVCVLSSVGHPNIVRHEESFFDGVFLHIIMEHAGKGDLDLQITRQRRRGRYLTEDRILFWFAQICMALKHIHDRKILHRDLKPENIFISEEQIIKVGDFGFTEILGFTGANAKTFLGTPHYMSPELCQSLPYNNKSDMWALGCVLYKLVSLGVPFSAPSFSELVSMICDSPTPKVPKSFSPGIQDVVDMLLQKDPVLRPSINQLFRDVRTLKVRAKDLMAESFYKEEFPSDEDVDGAVPSHEFSEAVPQKRIRPMKKVPASCVTSPESSELALRSLREEYYKVKETEMNKN